jgi:hypothetical protein
MPMKISVGRTKLRGERVWVVSWKPSGEKRNRRYFDTKTAADTEAETLRSQQKRTGEVWLAMSAEQRDEVVRLVQDAAREDFRLREAFDYFRANRDLANRVVTLGDAFQKFIVEKEASLLSIDTRAALRSNVGRFVKGRELRPLRSIARDEVFSYLSRPEWGPRTFNTYLTSLNTFFIWCVNVELLMKSPSATINKIPERRMPDLDVAPAIIDLGQSETLLRATLQTDPGLIRYVAVGLFGGLRPEREAGKLQPGDIFNGFIRVRGLHAKDRQRRDVEIHPTLQAWLDLGGDSPLKNPIEGSPTKVIPAKERPDGFELTLSEMIAYGAGIGIPEKKCREWFRHVSLHRSKNWKQGLRNSYTRDCRRLIERN